MFAGLLDRVLGPALTSRTLADGPTYGWVHLDAGICQVELTLYRVTTARARRRRSTVAWEVEWAADLTNERHAPITGGAVPVPEDAVVHGAWDVLACVLLRHEIALNPARYGLGEAA